MLRYEYLTQQACKDFNKDDSKYSYRLYLFLNVSHLISIATFIAFLPGENYMVLEKGLISVDKQTTKFIFKCFQAC